MSASDLHTQPPSPPGPGWEPAPASHTHHRQREEKLRVAARRRADQPRWEPGHPPAHAHPAGRPETDASPIAGEAGSQPG